HDFDLRRDAADRSRQRCRSRLASFDGSDYHRRSGTMSAVDSAYYTCRVLVFLRFARMETGSSPCKVASSEGKKRQIKPIGRRLASKEGSSAAGSALDAEQLVLVVDRNLELFQIVCAEDSVNVQGAKQVNVSYHDARFGSSDLTDLDHIQDTDRDRNISACCK